MSVLSYPPQPFHETVTVESRIDEPPPGLIEPADNASVEYARPVNPIEEQSGEA